jgi:uncharacterized protein (TIGR00251 family)
MTEKRKYHFHNGELGSALAVKVIPRCSRNEITEVMEDGTIKIRLTAPPVEGKANEALIEFLAGFLKVAPSTVEIVGGKTSRDKLVTVMNQDAVDIQKRIVAFLAKQNRTDRD